MKVRAYKIIHFFPPSSCLLSRLRSNDQSEFQVRVLFAELDFCDTFCGEEDFGLLMGLWMADL